MKSKLIAVVVLLMLTAAISLAQSQTAQSAMVSTTLSGTAYQIEGTITWTFDRDAAETYYTNAWDGNPPVVTTGNTPAQTSSGAPAPDANKLMQHAQAQRCVFFSGGDLSGDTYTQTVNGTKGWKWTYTYNITPNQASVAKYTKWSAETTGGTVDIGFSGFVSSESYLKQTKKTKYSFTLVDALGSRVQNMTVTLQKFDGVSSWVAVGAPISLANPLPVTPTTLDYSYYGNAGVFGNSAVFGVLHAPNYMSAASVVEILASDSFTNNDADLTSGNVHQANFDGAFPGISEAGGYRLLVTGTIKENSSRADQTFAVTSALTEIGGC